MILIAKILYSLVYTLWCIVYDTLKLLVPYRSRTKSINNEIVLITGAGNYKKKTI